jgi:hypothetical protein
VVKDLGQVEGGEEPMKMKLTIGRLTFGIAASLVLATSAFGQPSGQKQPIRQLEVSHERRGFGACDLVLLLVNETFVFIFRTIPFLTG